ncbi:hypothetical protein WOC76_04805 [Methylocystis sp. IM3]|uniref:hypothetical protein n=1 Tax=unclassified Methylocystis TaxID=2625913 RepID=UPI0030FC149A
MSEIPSTVADTMGFLTPQSLSQDDLPLGDIPYLYSLVPMAQSAKSPIHALTSADGVVGSQYAQVKSYGDLMGTFCDRLLHNVGAL